MKKKPLFTIFLIVFIDLFGFGIILPLLPFIAEEFQANPFQIGLLVSSYSLFQLIGAPILGRLSDRYGRRKLLILSQLGTMSGFMLLGFANSLPLIFLSRVIDGITGGNISIAQAYIADITGQKDRAKGMGMLGAAFGLGFILGPALGGFLSQYGFSIPAFFAAAASLLSVIATSFLLKETVNLKKAQKSKRTRLSAEEFIRVVKSQPMGLLIIIFFLINFAFSAMTGTFALWTERTFGLGPAENGWLFAFIGITAVITQILILPRLVNKIGERNLLKLGTACLGFGLLAFQFVTTGSLIYFALALIAFGNGLSNPSIQALASESVSEEEYGGSLGFLQSSGSLGRVVGPALGGKLFNDFGKDSPFVFSAGLIWLVFVILTQFLTYKPSFMQTVKNKLKGAIK